MTNTIERIPNQWPLRNLSHSVRAGGFDWHVQIAKASATNPVHAQKTLVLLHGTGSSAHSWAELIPELSQHYIVIAPDLPGHGFTVSHQPQTLSLSVIANALAELLRTLKVDHVDAMIGHSAGATLALQYALSHPPPTRIVGLNPSLVNLPSFYHSFLAPLINPIATSSFVSSLIADFLPLTSMIDKLLDSTNSKLNGIQKERYKILFKEKNHINVSLNFMAATDIPELLKRAPEITAELTFLVANQDSWVRKEELMSVLHRYFPASHIIQEDGGHLFHEANPLQALQIIEAALASNATQSNT